MRGSDLGERLWRPVLAALAVLIVEAMIVLSGPAAAALFEHDAILQTVLSGVATLTLCCLAIWAAASLVVRSTGSVGRPTSDDPGPEQFCGIVAGVVGGALTAWALWPATFDAAETGAKRLALVVLAGAIAAFVVFVVISGLAWRVRRSKPSISWSLFLFAAAVMMMVVAAVWLRDAPDRIRGVLSLGAMCSACLAAVMMPGAPRAPLKMVAALSLVCVLPGVYQAARMLRSSPALHFVQTYAPATGGMLVIAKDARYRGSDSLTLGAGAGSP